MDRMNRILIFYGLGLITFGCYWDNEETLYPEFEICDTTSVSFSGDIVPILTNNCYNCHSNKNASIFAFDIRLEDHTDVAAVSHSLVAVVNYEPGYPPMPKGEMKLDSCLINTIEAWINDGFPDN